MSEEVTMADLEQVIRNAKYTRRDAGPKSIARAVYPLMEKHARWTVAQVTRGEDLLDRLEALLTTTTLADDAEETK